MTAKFRPQATSVRPPPVTRNDAVLEPIRNPILHLVVVAAPWIILAIIVLKGGFLDDPMFGSGLFAAALALFTFYFVMQRIPQTFDILWHRNVITDKMVEAAPPAPIESQNKEELQRETPLPTAQYHIFLNDISDWLNQRWGWGLGLLFAVLAFARFPYEYGGLNNFWQDFLLHRDQWSATLWLDMLGELCIGLLLGVLVWRTIVTGVAVRELGKRFDLNVQLGHPDGCGGLEPLGSLCLWNALLIAIPGIYLGAWILLGPRSQYGYKYVELHSRLLLVPIFLAPLMFFLPLWSVHQSMMKTADEVRAKLDLLGQSIDRIARDLLLEANELTPEDGDKQAKKLEFMQQIYDQSRRVPVWPFNTAILIKLASSEVVPFLSITSIGQPLLNVVENLMAWFRALQQ